MVYKASRLFSLIYNASHVTFQKGEIIPPQVVPFCPIGKIESVAPAPAPAPAGVAPAPDVGRDYEFEFVELPAATITTKSMSHTGGGWYDILDGSGNKINRVRGKDSAKALIAV